MEVAGQDLWKLLFEDNIRRLTMNKMLDSDTPYIAPKMARRVIEDLESDSSPYQDSTSEQFSNFEIMMTGSCSIETKRPPE
ncbi:hypothetical protein TNCV_2703391 [Trichonephila clavipes]|nr:hypothetical protein TNCV_2703391 [Trichonephila clavipes]